MSAKKKLNIGLVGAGFMGRTHSNAFSKVNQFFELDSQPVLKAVCARNAAGAKAFAANWGFEAFETDWRELVSRETSTSSTSRARTIRMPRSPSPPRRRARW